VFSAPNGKQLLSRMSETGNNNFKVDYIPVIAGQSRDHHFVFFIRFIFCAAVANRTVTL